MFFIHSNNIKSDQRHNISDMNPFSKCFYSPATTKYEIRTILFWKFFIFTFREYRANEPNWISCI